jgi:putative FmdB family regulatory protein
MASVVEKQDKIIMPIYEYKCAACGQNTEFLQKISDAPMTDCPECGKAALSKQISNTSFRLTGDGWYVTDFKDGGKKKAPDSGQAPSTTSTKD